jgi:hypothetical protein
MDQSYQSRQPDAAVAIFMERHDRDDGTAVTVRGVAGDEGPSSALASGVCTST